MSDERWRTEQRRQRVIASAHYAMVDERYTMPVGAIARWRYVLAHERRGREASEIRRFVLSRDELLFTAHTAYTLLFDCLRVYVYDAAFDAMIAAPAYYDERAVVDIYARMPRIRDDMLFAITIRDEMPCRLSSDGHAIFARAPDGFMMIRAVFDYGATHSFILALAYAMTAANMPKT